jgi:hypothetical protein
VQNHKKEEEVVNNVLTIILKRVLRLFLIVKGKIKEVKEEKVAVFLVMEMETMEEVYLWQNMKMNSLL